MTTDSPLQHEVMAEPRCGPSTQAALIGVAVNNGGVSLAGATAPPARRSTT